MSCVVFVISSLCSINKWQLLQTFSMVFKQSLVMLFGWWTYKSNHVSGALALKPSSFPRQDKNGFITKDELAAVLTHLGCKATSEDVETMLKEARSGGCYWAG